MKFTKMHGAGNDYIYVNTFVEKVGDPAALAIKISDRHFGIGGDGLVLIAPADAGAGADADVRMRMFNADGSESEMCGNAIRCVAKYAFEHGLSRHNPMKVQTGRGVLSLDLRVDGTKVSAATVDMLQPILELAKIPVDPAKLKLTGEHTGQIVELGERVVAATFVSMGNPHAVFFVPQVKSVDVANLGPLVENAGAFPRRINAHWVQIHSRSEVTMRTWERGSGITLACGTGACAVCVAGVLTGRTDRKILAHLPGGDLTLEWREFDNNIYLTGPATEVFSGEWPG